MEAGGGVKVEYHIKPRFAAFGDDMVEPVKLRVALAAVFFEEKLAPERDPDAVRAELRYIFHIFVGDKPVHGLAAGQDADIAGLMAQLADSPSLSKNDSRLTAVLADSVRRPVTLDRADSVISGDFAGAGCGIL